MSRRSLPSLAAYVSLIAVSGSASALELPAVFGDHMVLTEKATVFGRAEPGRTVTVDVTQHRGSPDPAVRFQYAYRFASVADAEGRFEVGVDLSDFEAGVPLTVKVSERGDDGGSDSSVRFEDVLVGDVWVCSGQSNMNWPLLKTEGGREAAVAAADEGLRLFRVADRFANRSGAEASGTWSVSAPESAKSFSAVGYYFGRALRRETGRPIGLIHTAWGGTPIEAWTPPEALAGRDAEAYAEYAAEPLEVRPKSKTTNAHRRPAHLWHGKVEPLLPFGVTGVIWYQGEANSSQPESYAELQPSMIEGWRAAWERPELPFLFAQLPGFAPKQGDAKRGKWAAMREAQAAATTLPAVGMAVTIDVGDEDDIHPRKKEPVGERLALLARKIAYGEDVLAEGPVPVDFEYDGPYVRITFENAGGGLRDDCPTACGTVEGFEVAGADGAWRAADVTVVTEDRLEVDAFDVEEPVAVRYAWADFPAGANLFGGTGLPAAPFRHEK